MSNSQKWFEMAELRQRSLDTKVWIPLAASHAVMSDGQQFHLGYQEEYFACETVAVPLNLRSQAEQLEWIDLSNNGQGPEFFDKEYMPADQQLGYGDEPIGTRLVLRQSFTMHDADEWHLHQDLVIALGLKREEDAWVCPQEAYEKIACLQRKENGEPALLLIRAEHLRDYLQARGMGLLSSTFICREAIIPDANHISWLTNHVKDLTETQRWEGSIQAVHEGGMSFGAKTNVIHVGRINVDKGEDIPAFGLPTDDEVAFSSQVVNASSGRLLIKVQGELWRTDWLDPAAFSARVRRDPTPGVAHFITDTAGTQEAKETLDRKGRWLWFRPQVMNELVSRRGSTLVWHTRETGLIAAVPNNGVAFGLNELGLINVYAKDIARLPDWQQKVWAGQSVSPDGGVCAELLASQMKALPASSEAPEVRLARVLTTVNSTAESSIGCKLLRPHPDYADILKRTHRFRATDYPNLLALAKDIARLTADSIDVGAVQKLLPPVAKGEKALGSLKSLEQLLAKKIDATEARTLLTPLVGIYELRLGDAHLAGSQTKDALDMLKIDYKAPFVWQGEYLLAACTNSLERIEEIFRTHFVAAS